ncbi:MAG: hypothetical protein QHJ73_08420 [Armatimonadota bacterium]|nr:hypothetical protein [Armatimonadota bacterium]
MRTSRNTGSWKRRLLWAAGALLVVAGAGLWAAYRMVTYQPPPPPRPPVDFRAADQAAQRVEAELRALRAPGPPQRRRLVLRSSEVNALLATRLPAAGPLPGGVESVRDVQVRFQKGRVVVSGYVTTAGRTLYLTVAGRALPDGAGGVRFDAEEALVGKMPMPPAMRDELVGRVEAEVARQLNAAGVAVTALQITDGAIVVEGMSRARR